MPLPEVIRKISRHPELSESHLEQWQRWGLVKLPDGGKGPVRVLRGAEQIVDQPLLVDFEILEFLPDDIENLWTRSALARASEDLVDDLRYEVLHPEVWQDAASRRRKPASWRALPPDYRHLLSGELVVDLMMAGVSLCERLWIDPLYAADGNARGLLFQLLPDYAEEHLRMFRRAGLLDDKSHRAARRSLRELDSLSNADVGVLFLPAEEQGECDFVRNFRLWIGLEGQTAVARDG